MPSTKGLKSGDLIAYDDGQRQFTAIIINVTSTQKAQVRPLIYVDNIFNPTRIINTYRKFMMITEKN